MAAVLHSEKISVNNKTEYTSIHMVGLFTVLRPAQEFFTYMETSSLPVKGCKM
jgi:hypothetical protein